MRRFILNVIAAALAGPPASAAPLPPTGKWVLNYAQTYCTLHRDRVGDQPGIAFRTRPTAQDHELLIFLSPTGAKKFQSDGDVIAGNAIGAKRLIAVWESKTEGHRLIETTMTSEELSAASRAGSLRVAVNSALDVKVALPAMEKALVALRACEEDLAKRWGIDRNWAMPPKALTDVRALFRAEDYPDTARNRAQQGAVRPLLWVNEQGRVADCTIIESSSVDALDKATCDIIKNRARFSPALAADGRPMKSKLVAPVVRYQLGW